MGAVRWIAGASAVAGRQRYTFAGTWQVDDIIRAQVGAAVLDFPAGSATTGTVVSNLVAAWNALSNSLYPQFRKLTASAVADDFRLTGPNTGEPFVVTLTPLEANGDPADAQTIEGGLVATTGTTQITASGPNDWNVAANWDTAAVPVNADDVTIEETSTPILWGLDQSAVALASLTVRSLLSGMAIGLPKTNVDGYAEYLLDYLKIGADAITIDDTASRRIKIQQTGATSIVRVLATGSGEDQLGALQLRGTLTTLDILGGRVDVARYSDETATITAYRNSGGTVYLGTGVATIADGRQSSGDTTAYTDFTDLNNAAGTFTLRGANVSATVRSEGTLYFLDTSGVSVELSVDEGITYYRSNVTIPLLRTHTGGRFVRDRDLRPLIATLAVMTAGSAIIDGNRTMSWPGGIELDRCALHEVEIDVGSDVTLFFTTGSAPAPPGGLTQGSVIFVDAIGNFTEDNLDFSYNPTTNVLSVDLAGNVTGDVTGNLIGNASTATALQTARTINGVSFNGTANIVVAASAATLTGTTLASNVVTSSLTSVGTLGALNVTGTVTAGAFSGPLTGNVTGNASTATALQTARTINGVAFDGTENVTVPAAAGTLTGTILAGNVVTSTLTSVGTLISLDVDGTVNASLFAGPLSGNANTATALETARLIDGVSFDGTDNINTHVLQSFGGNASANVATSHAVYAGAGGHTLTLPNHSTILKPLLVIHRGSAGLLTISGNVNINGSASLVLAVGESVTIYKDTSDLFAI